jgi:hypothetical protein
MEDMVKQNCLHHGSWQVKRERQWKEQGSQYILERHAPNDLLILTRPYPQSFHHLPVVPSSLGDQVFNA